MYSEPGYWMNETSGVLRPAVEAFLLDRPLSETHIAALRAYLRQWIGAEVWDLNPHAGAADRARLATLRGAIDGLTSREAISRWIEAAVAEGLDPF